jgi:integrase
MDELRPRVRQNVWENMVHPDSSLVLVHEAHVHRRAVTNPDGRKFAERWFHSLRHTLFSDLANSTSHPEIRRKLTGHKTASVHDLYTHFERETLRAAVHAIPSLPEL